MSTALPCMRMHASRARRHIYNVYSLYIHNVHHSRCVPFSAAARRAARDQHRGRSGIELPHSATDLNRFAVLTSITPERARHGHDLTLLSRILVNGSNNHRTMMLALRPSGRSTAAFANSARCDRRPCALQAATLVKDNVMLHGRSGPSGHLAAEPLTIPGGIALRVRLRMKKPKQAFVTAGNFAVSATSRNFHRGHSASAEKHCSFAESLVSYVPLVKVRINCRPICSA